MIKGKVHSIETMGLVDGPGIRVVVFFQGCSLRCKYCHNPDTWSFKGGDEYTPEELVNRIERYKNYFDKSNGGVTFSGGEPLMQPEFLEEVLRLCKEKGIHTCLDTSGHGKGNYKNILKYTDLILYDIKHYTKDGYKDITLMENIETLKFLKDAQENGNKIWIRHVVVPGITDGEEHIIGLKEFINNLKNIEKVELLPYHLLGVNKYETIGLKYPLEGVEPMSKEKIKEYLDIIEKK